MAFRSSRRAKNIRERVAVGTYRMPPLPSLSLGWHNGRPRVTSPLQRMTKVTIDLESVDYGPPPGPPSLLRRPN